MKKRDPTHNTQCLSVVDYVYFELVINYPIVTLSLNISISIHVYSIMKIKTHCNFTCITESKEFQCLCKDSQVKHYLTCSSSDVIYLITCKKCKLYYVDQTSQKCRVRMNSHNFAIKHFQIHSHLLKNTLILKGTQ